MITLKDCTCKCHNSPGMRHDSPCCTRPYVQKEYYSTEELKEMFEKAASKIKPRIAPEYPFPTPPKVFLPAPREQWKCQICKQLDLVVIDQICVKCAFMFGSLENYKNYVDV